MENVIIADSSGAEIRAMLFSSYDFEVGDEDNSFQIVCLRSEYDTIPQGARIYIPGTEFGGIFRQLQTNTERDTITPGGITWRGMMQKKIIEPPSGHDYATDSGDLNAIIKQRVEAAFPGVFIGTATAAGASVSGYQYDRYCTLEEGLRKLLKSKGYRLDISYSQTDKAVLVQALPIVDYSSQIELSSDMQLNYQMNMQGDGVNHLICLGQGELRDRTVYHLYVDQNGDIGTTQYYFGADEIAEVYDYAGAELDDLISGGRKRLEERMNRNTFSMDVEEFPEVAIGDIVGGRDYLSGMLMAAPIAGKVVRWQNGTQRIEYTLADEVTASLF